MISSAKENEIKWKTKEKEKWNEMGYFWEKKSIKLKICFSDKLEVRKDEIIFELFTKWECFQTSSFLVKFGLNDDLLSPRQNLGT